MGAFVPNSLLTLSTLNNGISDLQEEIYTLKQGDNSISTYYTKMKKLRHELVNFCPIPEPNCLNNCSVILKMKQYRDYDQAIRFLKGFNEQYSHVRAQIMLMNNILCYYIKLLGFLKIDFV
ncbi:hypothetical protein QL285_039952 [Trifolium repens]|nr:hypothetical protein QL285_039952 [Trifolium repens]